MSISLIKQPNVYHSSLNTNWWSFQSDMRFAPRFNIRAEIKDGSTIYNTLLLPTAPNTYNILDIKNIMRDYVLPDFNCFITNPTQSTSFKNYTINVQETFEGLWVFGTSSVGRVGTVSVVNNTSLTGFATPSSVSEIDFIGGPVTSPAVWAINYGTGSNGFVNRINLSSSETTFIPVTASIGSNSSGYLILADYNIYTNAATFSTGTKRALIGNIDYLDYNETNNFDGYIMGESSSKFLTNAPRVQPIQANEYSTLSMIISTTQSIHSALYTDNFGATFSRSLTGLSQSIKVDIPTGTANLAQLNPNATSYCVQLQKTTPTGLTASSERFCYEIDCLNSFSDSVRLTWLNRLGGIDYYTFRFTESNNIRMVRDNFNKNVIYNSTKQDRGISTYKLDYHNEYTVVSDLLDDETSEWLAELASSTEVYWIYNNELIPITIIGTDYGWNTGFENREARFNFRLSRTNYK